jgi:hypothetical protein
MTSTKNKESSIKSSPKKVVDGDSNWYFTVLLVVIAVTFATRFYRVNEPDHVW